MLKFCCCMDCRVAVLPFASDGRMPPRVDDFCLWPTLWFCIVLLRDFLLMVILFRYTGSCWRWTLWVFNSFWFLIGLSWLAWLFKMFTLPATSSASFFSAESVAKVIWSLFGFPTLVCVCKRGAGGKLPGLMSFRVLLSVSGIKLTLPDFSSWCVGLRSFWTRAFARGLLLILRYLTSLGFCGAGKILRLSPLRSDYCT